MVNGVAHRRTGRDRTTQITEQAGEARCGTGGFLAIAYEHIARQLSRLHPVVWRPLAFVQHTQRYWVVWHQRLHASAEHRWFRALVFELWQQSQFGVTGNYVDSP